MPFSGFQDLNPDFARQLQAYFAANPGLSAYSGYRTPEHQRQLFLASDRTGHSVGTPTGSQHVHRLAADLAMNGVRLDRLPLAQQKALQQSAGTFGLKFPMSWEAWHIEPASTRGGRMAGGGAVPADMSNVTDNANATAARDDNLAAVFAPVAETNFDTGSSSQTEQPGLRSSGRPAAPDLSAFEPSTPAPVARPVQAPDLAPLADLFQIPAIGQNNAAPAIGQPIMATSPVQSAVPRRRWA